LVILLILIIPLLLIPGYYCLLRGRTIIIAVPELLPLSPSIIIKPLVGLEVII